LRERMVQFGPQGILAGVLTEPAPANRRQGAPAVVLSNVGMHSRIGPYRMWVELAGRLAAEGWVVLRFDLSGWGDSETRPEALGDIERAAREQREAIDFLAGRGATSAVLVGLCSGVDGVHAASVADPRVAGVVHLDGYAYPTAGLYLRRWTLRLLRPRVWRSFLRRRWQYLRDMVLRPPAPAEAVFDRTYPPYEALAADYRALVARGARLQMVWSGSGEREFNHVGQFFTMLRAPDLRGRVDVSYIARADHLFSVRADRAALFGLLAGWLDRSFPSGAGR
jgi:hypothetical protein